MRLRDGRRLTALDLQWAYYERAKAFVDERYGSDADDQTTDMLQRWESVLTKLGDDPMSCSDSLDWVAKLRLLEGYRERENLTWSSPKLQLVDLQYADVRPEKGLYHRLVARGSMKTLLDPDDTQRAMYEPPEDTRAYFRGRCLEKYAEHVAAASWDSVIFDLPGRDSLQRVPTLEPLRGTRNHVKELLDRCRTAEDLVRVLSGG
jgi:proteasome accessory factor A